MHNRRNFLLQSGMAATALLAAKPVRTLAGMTGNTQISGNPSLLVFLHTDSPENKVVTDHIQALRKGNTNLLLINSGKALSGNPMKIKFDVSRGDKNLLSFPADYHILYKDNIKIGMIRITVGSDEEINRINTVSKWLKKEKDCQLVVCLSDLGYKNDHGPDDLKLAKLSSNLDVIISGNCSNFSHNSNIILNRNKEEVIISHSADQLNSMGKFSIGFNDNMQKNSISF